ncbi:MAG: FAD:protein FMN transferase [Victivallaceae bacterium]|nr:FAD:protein FMN transferase [Victivallaceae bacterium]
MGPRTVVGVGTGIVLILVAVAMVSMSPVRIVREFTAMGTTACIDVVADASNAESAYGIVLETFAEVARCCNVRTPESEISRLNVTAFERPFHCGPLLWDVLCEARRAYRETGGVFDISVKPVEDMWREARRNGKTPSKEERAVKSALCGLDKVSFDDDARTVRFKIRGMALTLDGIAKGYALDLAGKRIQAAGISTGVLDLGGNLLLLDPPDGSDAFTIAMRDPRNPSRNHPEGFRCPPGHGVSTSGNYERFFEIGNVRYGHILDPATGEARPDRHAVTVAAPSACEADWMSTAVFLRPELADKPRPGRLVFIIGR